MPTLDRLHDAVRHALEKDGWTITHDPLTLRAIGRSLHIDLADAANDRCRGIDAP